MVNNDRTNLNKKISDFFIFVKAEIIFQKNIANLKYK